MKGWHIHIPLSQAEEKTFFFEKKNQKTFTNLASNSPDRHSPGFKSFLLLFFKKEVLAS